jgi:hypothetical protein
MDSLASLIVELQNARWKLLRVFEVPNNISTAERPPQRVFNGTGSIWSLVRMKAQ